MPLLFIEWLDMRNFMMLRVILSITLATALLPISSVYGSDVEPYQLKEGDMIDISVWDEDSLQKEVRILPDGSITFPLIGRLEVKGLSSTDIELQISNKLKEYIPDPEVTVMVTNTDGNRIYVLGKVNTPGPILMAGPMTVLQALSFSGGLDKFAAPEKIKIIRKSASGQKILPVNYRKLLEGVSLEENYSLQADDTILVP